MKKKKAAGIAIGVLLAAVVVVFGATQLKLCKVKSSDVQLEDIYQTDEHHFVIRYQIPEDCSPADAYSTSDQIHLDRKGDIAELSFSYKRPFIKGRLHRNGDGRSESHFHFMEWRRSLGRGRAVFGSGVPDRR